MKLQQNQEKLTLHIEVFFKIKVCIKNLGDFQNDLPTSKYNAIKKYITSKLVAIMKVISNSKNMKLFVIEIYRDKVLKMLFDNFLTKLSLFAKKYPYRSKVCFHSR